MFVGVVSLCLVLAGTQDLFAEASRPLEEMRGGCDNFAWNMQMELAAMGRPTKLVQAGVDREKASEIHPGPQPFQVSLHRKEEVSFLVGPRPNAQSVGHYAGLLAITVPQDGVYRMSTTGPMSLEVMSESGPVRSQGFEMQTGCVLLFKSEAFPLRVGTRYWLQVSDSMTASAHVLMTRVP